jgi:hypothetical protein
MATPSLSGARGPALELGFVAIALALNLVVRWYTVDDLDVAVRNAHDVLAAEQALHLDWEHAVQDVTLAVPGLATLSSWYYVAGYFPLVLGTLVWLYLRDLRDPRGGDAYRLLRNALLASGAIGLIGYAFYPTAPPRLTHVGLSDPLAATRFGDAARPAGIANEIAAIPSFHVGWLLLAMLVAASVVHNIVLRVLLLAQPLLMSYVIVATANHWVLDIPAGVAIALVGWYVARWLSRLGPSAQRSGRLAAAASPGSVSSPSTGVGTSSGAAR